MFNLASGGLDSRAAAEITAAAKLADRFWEQREKEQEEEEKEASLQSNANAPLRVTEMNSNLDVKFITRPYLLVPWHPIAPVH